MHYTYYRRSRNSSRRRRKASSFAPFLGFVGMVLVLILMLYFVLSWFGQRRDEAKDELTLSVYKGEVSYQIFGTTDWKSAASSQVIQLGARVQTETGAYARLSFQNGTELFLDEDSVLLYDGFKSSDGEDQFLFDLESGRILVEQVPYETGELELLVKSDVMNVSSVYGSYLFSNRINQEYVYPLEESVQLELVERGVQDDIVIESTTLRVGQRSFLSDEQERALLAREDLDFVENIGASFQEDDFVRWSTGDIVWPELNEVEEVGLNEEFSEAELESEIEEELIEEEFDELVAPESAVDSLKISILSPASGSTIQKDAIALEGQVTAGEASRISVTWSGNGQAYDLSLYEAGASSFRYVADVDYGNYALGQNSYTIVAYDADGVPSNTVVVQLTAEF